MSVASTREPAAGGRPTTITIATPGDFLLSRDVCSYGYFLLAPNRWDVGRQALIRPLVLTGGPATAVVTQAGDKAGAGESPGGRLRARFDRPLTRAEQAEARGLLARMLRLWESEAEARAFHAVDPRWAASGRARLFRSPTLFEDVVKTVTSCNVAWPSTIRMNERLCAVLGAKGPSGVHAFPAPEKLARTRAGTLRARCGVGYRDRRLIDLAGLFGRGEIDGAWLEDAATPDDDVFAFLLGLPGVGPYAAGNIMQLLGRYSRLAIDTETVRHAKTVLGFTGEDGAIMKRVARHYEPFGAQKFRSYWFELWDYYETKRGPAHLWDRETTGKTFTAAQFDDAPRRRAGKKASAGKTKRKRPGGAPK